MKTKLVALLLCIILCLGLCVPALGANSDGVTASASLDQAKLEYDADNDRTVTLTVTLSKTVGLYSVSFVADIPSELTLTSITSDIPNLSSNVNTGIVSWFDLQGNNVDTTNLAVLTVTVPAGTPAKNYQIGIKEIELYSRVGTTTSVDTVIENGTAYATLTIADAAPTAYTVKFDANGGTGSMKDVTVNDGDKLTLPECGFTAPSGKQFKAWSVGGKEYAAGAEVAITANTTVKAVWEAATFTVSFDAGDGAGTMTAATDVSGEYTLPECTLTAPEGKQFKAWSVNGTEYAAGAKVAIIADTTVKAVWEDIPAVTYTVKFDANGGSGSMKDKTVTEGKKLTLPECDFTAPEGKQFKAWAIGSKEYAVGEKASIKADTTVKAVWEDIPVTYTVSFDPGEGKGEMPDITALENEELTLPDCGFTAPEGQEFKAWRIPTEKEGEYKDYGENNVYKVMADTVVTALWKDAPVELETVATPKLPKEGKFSGTKTITITCATKGADIYYTTDGSKPSAASTLYTGSFTISATTTVKAIAIKSGMNDSEIASATYTKSSGGGGGGGGGGSSDDGDTIRVKMRLIGAEVAKKDVDLGKSSYLPAYVTWIPTTSYTLDEGATVYDLFVKATKKAGIRSIGADDNYVETIFAPDSLGGYELSEFTNGKRSGWMYTINGKHPGFGLKDQKLRDGDVVIWHYVNDYSYEVEDWVSEGQWQALGDGTYYNGWLKAPDRFGAKSKEDEEEEEEENLARFENGVVILEAETDSGTATAKLDKETAETGLKKSKDKDRLTVEIENEKASRIILNVEADAVKAIADAQNALRVETDKGSVTLSSADMRALAKNGKDVRIIFEDQASGAVKLSVTAGGKAADVALQVELPASKGSQVLVLVNADGTEKVIKKSIVENGKAYAEIPSGATVKVVANKKTFKDVKSSDWFASAVDFVSSHELFQGVGNDEFAPKSNMTRAMLVTVLYRLQNEPKAGNTSFDDVPADTWYTKAVAWAAEEGIVLGNGDGFAPNDNITREQIATILYRYMKYLGVDVSAKGDLSKFKDGKDVSSWAQDAMLWAEKVGLFQGDDQGKLNPRSNANRAEVATLMQRLVKMLVLK